MIIQRFAAFASVRPANDLATLLLVTAALALPVTAQWVNYPTTPLYRKVVQVPGLLAILNEHDAFFRQIYTDGRPLPSDPHPSWRGYSSGQWHGDTLVVQTAGFRDNQWLDMGGTPMTDAAKLTERFRRPDHGHLESKLRSTIQSLHQTLDHHIESVSRSGHGAARLYLRGK